MDFASVTLGLFIAVLLATALMLLVMLVLTVVDALKHRS